MSDSIGGSVSSLSDAPRALNATRADGGKTTPSLLMSSLRLPAVPVALSFAFGILIDRWAGVAWSTWIVASLAFVSGWCFAFRRRYALVAPWLLCAACFCLGGARHHQVWSVTASNDIALFADDQTAPATLWAVVETEPDVRLRDGTETVWLGQERTTCVVRCQSLLVSERRVSVSGKARLDVTGRLTDIAIGDAIEIHGHIAQPRGARNPGAFNFRTYLQRRGIRCIVWADFPEAVRKIGPSQHGWLARLRAHTRRACVVVLRQQMSSRSEPVALALFLGKRSGVTDTIRKAFVESGTMHLLSISGLHVGILAMFLWSCGRLLNVSRTGLALCVVAGVASYAFLTDARPPVIRATILIVVTLAALPWHRQVLSGNVLALAAIIVLVRHPCDLFDPGAQLSFVAVIALIWSATRRVDWVSSWLDARWSNERDARQSVRDWCLRTMRWLERAYAMSAAVWLFTAPLVAVHFNIVCPVGLLMNVLLIPVVILALWLGFAVLACAWFAPILATVFGTGCDLLLRSMLAIVDQAAAVELGHLYVPSPPGWWLAGCYGLLAGLIVSGSVFRTSRVWWRGLGVWLALGLLLGLRPTVTSRLRCTFLDVGHGCAVLLQMPNGRTLLYDAGMMNSPHRAARTVEAALWECGSSHIDALVLSHPDSDHFNGAAELLDDIPVGKVAVARTFLTEDNPRVWEIGNAAFAHCVSIALIGAGDRIKLDDRVAMTVLHPPWNFASATDNANCIVLLVELAGRGILLTGDLDGEGQDQLLGSPPRKVDVLMAPHHGSLNANPVELAAWARPDIVVVSGPVHSAQRQLQNRYGTQTSVLWTGDAGAITIEVTSDGSVTVHGI